MNPIREDAVFGHLEFDDVWCRKINVPIFSSQQEAELIIVGSEQFLFTEGQREAYRWFSDNTTKIIQKAVTAVAGYISNNFHEDVDTTGGDGKISLSYIMVLDIFTDDAPGLAVLFDSPIDLENGFAVEFRSGELFSVGGQEIVL